MTEYEAMIPERPDKTWEDAGYRLPSAANLPCEVILASGKKETRKALEGSWLKVVWWRSVKKK